MSDNEQGALWESEDMLQPSSDVATADEYDRNVIRLDVTGVIAELRRLERKLDRVLSSTIETKGRSSTKKSEALSIVATHRAIDSAFGLEGLATSPAWDILLEIYAAGTLAVSNAAVGGGCSLTTGLRWLAVLEGKGWIHRFEDARDGRRKLVVLSSKGKTLVESGLDLYGK